MIIRSSFFYIGIIIFHLQACSQKNLQQETLIKESVANFNSQRYKEALISFDNLIALDSADYVSWAFRGRTLHLLKRDDEAFTSLNKALSINNKYYEGYGYRATIYSLHGQPEIALRDINMALSGNAYDTTLLQIRAGFFLKINKFDSAILDCNYLIKLNPKNSQTLYQRGRTFRQMGHIQKALNDFNSAIEIDPNDPKKHNDRGFLFIAQEKYDLAILDFTRSIQLAGNRNLTAKAYSYNNRGFCQYKNSNLREALKDVNYSIQFLPVNSYAYKNKALIYFGMKEKTKACLDLKVSLSLGFTEKFGNEVLTLQSINCK